MQFITSTQGILTIEAFVLIIIILLYLLRSPTADDIEEDVEKIKEFLDKVDHESLINFSKLDTRHEERSDTIQTNVDEILKIMQRCNSEESCKDIHKVSHEYIKIIQAVEAIKQREIEELKRSKE